MRHFLSFASLLYFSNVNEPLILRKGTVPYGHMLLFQYCLNAKGKCCINVSCQICGHRLPLIALLIQLPEYFSLWWIMEICVVHEFISKEDFMRTCQYVCGDPIWWPKINIFNWTCANWVRSFKHGLVINEQKVYNIIRVAEFCIIKWHN